MLYAFQDYRLGSAVDAADRAPVAVPNPHPVLVAVERPSGGMFRERFGGENLHAGK